MCCSNIYHFESAQNHFLIGHKNIDRWTDGPTEKKTNGLHKKHTYKASLSELTTIICVFGSSKNLNKFHRDL